MSSNRQVITEDKILAIECPTCRRGVGKPCVQRVKGIITRLPLTFVIGDTEFRFHRERMYQAFQKQSGLDATDKALITYYAFIMLADSVSSKSVLMFSKSLTSEEVQTFFATKAIEELRKDHLLD